MKFGPVHKKGVTAVAYYTVFEAILKIAWCSYLVINYNKDYDIAVAEWNKSQDAALIIPAANPAAKTGVKNAVATAVSPVPGLTNFVPRNASNPHEDLAYTGFFVHNILFHVFSLFSGIALYAGVTYGFRPLVMTFAIYGLIYCFDQLAVGFLVAYVAIRLLKCDKDGECEPWIKSVYQPGHNSYPLFRGYSPIQILFGIFSSICVYAVCNYLHFERRSPSVRAAQKAAYLSHQAHPGGMAGLPIAAATLSMLSPIAPTVPPPPTNRPSRHSR